MNSWIAKNIIYRGIQFARREPVFRTLTDLERTQWLAPHELATLQRDKLRRLLVHAYENTEFYHHRFREAAFDPYAFHAMEQLASIPPLTKSDLQTASTALTAARIGEPYTTEFTSGSTGAPRAVHISRSAAAAFRATAYRQHRWAGLDVGSKEARFYGLPTSARMAAREQFKDTLMNRQRFSVFALSDDEMARHWQRLLRMKPDYLYGYTSAIYRFSDYLHRMGIQPDIGVKAIIVTSEMLHPTERTTIENVWHTKVYNEYGASEVGVIAHECPHGSMHLTAENNVVEFIANGKPAMVGEPGEVVVTSLDNRAMPLIRYRIGDVGVAADGLCPCGRGLPLMHVVEGRLNSMLLTPGGQVLSGFFFYYLSRELFEHDSAIRQFVVVQRAVDHLHFMIRSDATFSQAEYNRLVTRTQEYVGSDVRITHELVDAIPTLPSGKLMQFVSEIDIDLAGSQHSLSVNGAR